MSIDTMLVVIAWVAVIIAIYGYHRLHRAYLNVCAERSALAVRADRGEEHCVRLQQDLRKAIEERAKERDARLAFTIERDSARAERDQLSEQVKRLSAQLEHLKVPAAPKVPRKPKAAIK